MIGQTKNADSDLNPPVVEDLDSETQDEIDQIMSEIEELQQEMNAADPSISAGETALEKSEVLESAAAAPSLEEATLGDQTLGLGELPDLDEALGLEELPLVDEALGSDKLLPAEPSPVLQSASVRAALPVAPVAKTAIPSVKGLLPVAPVAVKAVAPSVPEAEEEILEEFTGETDEPWLEETLAHLKAGLRDGNREIPEQKSLLDELVMDEAPPLETPPKSNQKIQEVGEGGVLAMTVKGNMTFRLNYGEKGDQSISVTFNSKFIHILLEDGTEVKIPNPAHTSKVV